MQLILAESVNDDARRTDCPTSYGEDPSPSVGRSIGRGDANLGCGDAAYDGFQGSRKKHWRWWQQSEPKSILLEQNYKTG